MSELEWGSSRRVLPGDGVVQYEVITHAHEPGMVYTKQIQPSEDIILERNQRLRNESGSTKDLGFGRLVATIPIITMMEWEKKYPELTKGDAKMRSQFLIGLLKQTENKKFLVRDKV